MSGGTAPWRVRGGPRVVAALMVPACGGDRDFERPTPRFAESPVVYPLELWERDVEGRTLVRVLVDEEGGVDSVVVAESSGHSALDSAAVRGVLGMAFEPATEAGAPVRVWARVPVCFSKTARPERKAAGGSSETAGNSEHSSGAARGASVGSCTGVAAPATGPDG